MKKIGIIGAMELEVETLKSKMNVVKTKKKDPASVPCVITIRQRGRYFFFACQPAFGVSHSVTVSTLKPHPFAICSMEMPIL